MKLLRKEKMAATRAWYEEIAHLCVPFVTIPLSPEDLAFLQSDETRLPAPCGASALLPSDPRAALARLGEGGALFSAPRPALEAGLLAALRGLGGAAFPTACGVAPWDAGWASQQVGFGESLRCCSAGEVWVLLMASERVQRAAAAVASAAAAGPCAPLAPRPCLVLRQWLADLRGEGEVRCAVQGGAVAQATRRRGGAPDLPPALRASVEAFVAAQDWRAASGGAERFLLDVYVPLGASGGGGSGIVVLDMAPCPQPQPADAGAGAAGAEGAGAEPPAPAPSGLHFHPWAAHAFPEEVLHYAAERVSASTVGRVGGGLEAESLAGGLVSELAQAHGEEQGLGGGGGWTALVEALHARGAFVRGGEEEEGEEG